MKKNTINYQVYMICVEFNGKDLDNTYDEQIYRASQKILKQVERSKQLSQFIRVDEKFNKTIRIVWNNALPLILEGPFIEPYAKGKVMVSYHQYFKPSDDPKDILISETETMSFIQYLICKISGIFK